MAAVSSPLHTDGKFSLSSELSRLIIVLVGGANLILVQWILVRELTALLLGTELVVLGVVGAYFVGLSVGFFLSDKIRPRWLQVWGILTLALHLSLPVWLRLIVAGLADLGAYALAFFLLPILTSLLISAFYSIFLPRFADQSSGSLATLYGIELLGSGLGVLLLFVLSGLGVQVVFLIYALNLLVLLYLIGVPSRRLVVAGVSGALWLAAFPRVGEWSNARWYESLHGLSSGTTTLYSTYSSYQKIDVMEETDGSRHLFLDGLSHFDSSSGQHVNVILGGIPQQLLQPRNALVIGAGVMRTEQMLAADGAAVTTVELDPLVVEAGLRYFSVFNQMDRLLNRSIVVDDAKHYLANTSDLFAYIAGDVPAAYSIQTATLHTQAFFQLVHGHLSRDGVFGTNLTSRFAPDNLVARRIASGLLQTFDEVIVVTPASLNWSFAYCADDLPFTTADLNEALRESGESQFSIYDTTAVRRIVGDAQPLTLDTMDLVFRVSSSWIQDTWSR